MDIAQNGEECIEVYKTSLKNTIKYNTTIRSDHSASSSSYSSFIFSPPSPYDAVVLDYRMPKKDGLEAAKEILALNPSQRIIFASAYVEETLRESIKELSQIVELMQKPFLPELLVEVVEDAEAYPELKNLFVKVRKMTESDFENPSPAQIRDILGGLKKIQKGRTF